MIHRYPITPIPKPRMTQRDKWKKRPAVLNYHAFKDECRLRGVEIHPSGCEILFVLPMPKSWSKAKKERMRGTAHQQRPDKDNLEKAIFDAVLDEDSVVWSSASTKVWGDEGQIIIKTNGYSCREIERAFNA